jgi:hypothetical protein
MGMERRPLWGSVLGFTDSLMEEFLKGVGCQDGWRFQVFRRRRNSPAAGLKTGQSNLKRNFVLGYFHMTD